MEDRKPEQEQKLEPDDRRQYADCSFDKSIANIGRPGFFGPSCLPLGLRGGYFALGTVGLCDGAGGTFSDAVRLGDDISD
ncbi:hypothetical protein JK207_09410 [Gluconobacter cerinus]|uniref:hypothetical protein n=1 Tax=Gluconobacter cerinus TaxID=38307 RepID=UPI001B8B41C2|nr:hypothetical protein [Gluconobacter cerinus]MBS0994383.1 hypothetical protein [Gluconobacter cerinus]MBS1022232.1 hypothetical protein [Gluconobacter cerinus]